LQKFVVLQKHWAWQKQETIMTLEEAIAAQPAWLGVWLNILVFGAFVAPLALFAWKATRLTGAIALMTSLLAGFGVKLMFDQMGYVKLLGLPHILLWTPLALFLWKKLQQQDLPIWPRRILIGILTVLTISLVFDYVDALRYLFGERTAFTG
jgi:hypothetical protein